MSRYSSSIGEDDLYDPYRDIADIDRLQTAELEKKLQKLFKKRNALLEKIRLMKEAV